MIQDPGTSVKEGPLNNTGAYLHQRPQDLQQKATYSNMYYVLKVVLEITLKDSDCKRYS